MPMAEYTCPNCGIRFETFLTSSEWASEAYEAECKECKQLVGKQHKVTFSSTTYRMGMSSYDEWQRNNRRDRV